MCKIWNESGSWIIQVTESPRQVAVPLSEVCALSSAVRVINAYGFLCVLVSVFLSFENVSCIEFLMFSVFRLHVM